MNKIVNKILLAADRFMPGSHLREPGFTYKLSETFTKNNKRMQKFKEIHNIFIKTN